MLNKSGESGHPCLVPDFSAKSFSFSPLSIMLAVGLSYITFIMLRYIPSVPTLVRLFIMNGCWILSNAFSASVEMILWILSFLWLMWCITLTDWRCWTILVTLGWRQLGHGVWSFLCVIGFGLLIFCWEFLHPYSSKIVILFFGSVFVWFWYQGDGGFMEWIWECSLLFSLLEEFEKNWYKIFFVCLVEFPSEGMWSWISVGREFVLLQILFHF